MKFLIPTEPDDSHAALVKLALEERGHSVRLLFTADQPTRQKNSVYVSNNGYQWKSSDKFDSITDNDYDVVWWRRARKPFLHKDMVHPDDHPFLMRENAMFYDSLTYNMAPDAWWVNSKQSASRANSKLLQLKTAAQCGMQIPVTLCSNDPNDIRYFLLKHETDGVIYKPLCSRFQLESKRAKVAYTSKLSFLDLPENKLLQLSPGIFQKEIRKQYELRVTCFGDYVVAVKLHSQAHRNGRGDWPAMSASEMSLEPYDLPSSLVQQIRAFMRRLGIVFGCFDFIVTPDDQYIFLEVHEQGQFLWVEENNADINMLDIFVNFLISRSIHFEWDARRLAHEISGYKDKIDYVVAENVRHHVNVNLVA